MKWLVVVFALIALLFVPVSQLYSVYVSVSLDLVGSDQLSDISFSSYDALLNASGLDGSHQRFVLFEFVDFQCEYCVQAHGVVQQIDHEYDDLSVSVVHFPFNPGSEFAAFGYECLEYDLDSLDSLFSLSAYSIEGVLELVDSSSVSQTLSCLLDNSTMARVDRDVDFANEVGVRGTPTFVLVDTQNVTHGKMFVGTPSVSLIGSTLATWKSE
jgi:protein-disulfide isomerase